MDQVWAAVGVILAAAVAELGRRGLAMLREWMDRQAVIGAAGRAAGQAVAAIKADPAGRAAVDDLAAKGAVYIATSLPGAIARLGVPSATLEGMVKGELGKLLAAAPPEAVNDMRGVGRP